MSLRMKSRAIPAWISSGIRRHEKMRKANIIAAPMRSMFSLLANGEVHEIEGNPVMRMPDIDAKAGKNEEWCAIAPAMLGWAELWERIAPDLSVRQIGYLAERLQAGSDLTPRLVERAREEFEATIARIPEIDEGVILGEITTCSIKWEMDKFSNA